MNHTIRYLLLSLTAILLLPVTASAQEWRPYVNRSYFQQIAPQLDAQYRTERQQAKTFALSKGWQSAYGDGQSLVELRKIGPGNHPVYYKLYNRIPAVTSGTNRLRLGSGLGLNITGKGMLVGVWDGSGFLESHREFIGRAESRGGISDEPIQGLGGEHSTHVTGTIAASGINPEARGMAFETNVFVYDFLNDDAEIAAELARDDQTLLVSNHSYGRVLGWEIRSNQWQWVGNSSVSSVEDYLFGFYDASSRLWDEFAFNAPYYLMVKAAGNDRSDVGSGPQPPDGPYDILDPQAVAKNVMTVGAVNGIESGYRRASDVVMSSFSSWGPTDDGRIKPDICADGVDVLSTTDASSSAYGLLSGTSMASPATAGSLILLQQLYSQTNNGRYMRAATLKGLAIHAANEAGAAPGPDYSFGWGLLATDRAASLLTRADDRSMVVREATLRNGRTLIFQVEASGTAPLIATISWTDVPGNPVSPQLDPQTLMLVNDLDMRVLDEEGEEYRPWILNPADPAQPATTGDNFRDNVEKIEIPTPRPGNYTIIITHKGTLTGGEQDFSLLVSTQNLNTAVTSLYWIGGNGGDWNNGANWSLSSGGAAANRVPTVETPVIFDQNSFTSPTPTINFPADAACFNLTWLASQTGTFQLNQNRLLVNGSVDVNTDGVRFQNGIVELSGQVSKRNFLRAPGQLFKNAELLLRSSQGQWSLLTDLDAGLVRVEGGGLNIVDRVLKVDRLQVPNGLGQSLNFSGSRVEIGTEMLLNPNASTNWANSTLVFRPDLGTTTFTLDGEGKAFHNIVANGITLTISGNATYNKLQVDGSLTLTGNGTFDSLVVAPGSQLTFGEGATYTFLETFQAVGANGNRTVMRTNGGLATFVADNPEIRFCFDFIEVNNIEIEGTTFFVSGQNSTISASSTGWFLGDCSDALFGDFSASFLCALGKASFTDRSTGNPTSWRWNFGDEQFPSRNTSTLQNPTHVYSFPGTYTVTLEVSDGSITRTTRRQVTVNTGSSNLTVPVILVEGQNLQSSLLAPSYQWYRNGVPINGATARSIQATSSATYTVEVSNGECRFESAPTVVGGFVQDELANTLLYPNPTADQVGIQMQNSLLGTVKISVYSLTGQLLLSESFDKKAQLFDQQLSLMALPSGLYHCAIELSGGLINQKILKR